METVKVRATLIEEMLGTKAANVDVFSDFIASKCPDGDRRKEELDRAEHREEAGTTVFHRTDDGELIIYDYQVKGFLKEAADVMRQAQTADEAEGDDAGEKKPAKNGKTKWGSAKRKFDNFVFVFPRIIRLGKKSPDGVCERPLRCETMKGPRVSVARSEVVAAGTKIEFQVKLLPGGPVTKEMILQCLDYGKLKGLGQWRNSGKGRFDYEVIGTAW